MIKIMFVCHGNICRSPMAEMVMKELVRRDGSAHRIHIASAGTSSEEIQNGIGNPIYPPAQKELRRHSIPFTAHRAVQLSRADYAAYDLFICMDRSNLYNARRIFCCDPEDKVHTLLSFAGRRDDVADPWYTGQFDTAFSDIAEGCTALLDYLKKEELL